MLSVSEPPACLLCGETTTLLYPSNVPEGAALESGEMACTSPYLSIHDDIFHCPRCRLARAVPPVDAADIGDLYRGVEDPQYLVSEEERRAEFRRYLDRIERFDFLESPGSLLEIGSAAGLFLHEAQERGWNAVGIEPSRWAAENARRLGVEVFNGVLDEFDARGRLFDVVASWDVWEHLENPDAALRRAHELVRPGGLLIFTTVNMGGLGAKIFRGRWPWFMRMHLHYFTPKSLSALVERAGFQVLSTSTVPKILKLSYLIDRARNFLGPPARLASWFAERFDLMERPVRIDLGDILLLEARKAP